MVICRRLAGRLFHSRGLATAKLPSPKLVRVREIASILSEEERRCGRPRLETSRYDRYARYFFQRTQQTRPQFPPKVNALLSPETKQVPEEDGHGGETFAVATADHHLFSRVDSERVFKQGTFRMQGEKEGVALLLLAQH